MTVLSAARKLRDAVAHYPDLAPAGKAAYILNPLDYAWKNHATYARRFAPRGHRVEAMFLGMNPGPWGMAQTGIPFGSPPMVRDFLGIDGEVKQPPRFHPKRPVGGLECPRREISGERVWGAVRDCFREAEHFFERFYLANYCPLVFQSDTGANVTPDKLPKHFLDDCERACVEHLVALIRALKPRTVICFGKWAEKQVHGIAGEHDLDVEIASVIHPSPANPQANRGWRDRLLERMGELGHPWPAPRAR